MVWRFLFRGLALIDISKVCICRCFPKAKVYISLLFEVGLCYPLFLQGRSWELPRFRNPINSYYLVRRIQDWGTKF